MRIKWFESEGGNTILYEGNIKIKTLWFAPFLYKWVIMDWIYATIHTSQPFNGGFEIFINKQSIKHGH